MVTHPATTPTTTRPPRPRCRTSSTNRPGAYLRAVYENSLAQLGEDPYDFDMHAFFDGAAGQIWMLLDPTDGNTSRAVLLRAYGDTHDLGTPEGCDANPAPPAATRVNIDNLDPPKPFLRGNDAYDVHTDWGPYAIGGPICAPQQLTMGATEICASMLWLPPDDAGGLNEIPVDEEDVPPVCHSAGNGIRGLTWWLKEPNGLNVQVIAQVYMAYDDVFDEMHELWFYDRLTLDCLTEPPVNGHVQAHCTDGTIDTSYIRGLDLAMELREPISSTWSQQDTDDVIAGNYRPPAPCPKGLANAEIFHVIHDSGTGWQAGSSQVLGPVTGTFTFTVATTNCEGSPKAQYGSFVQYRYDSAGPTIQAIQDTKTSFGKPQPLFWDLNPSSCPGQKLIEGHLPRSTASSIGRLSKTMVEMTTKFASTQSLTCASAPSTP